MAINNRVRVPDPILRRIYLLFVIFVAFGLLIIIQLIRLQWTYSHQNNPESGDRVYYRRQLADRGSILADDGSILAITVPSYRVAFDATVMRPRDYANFNDSLELLATLLAANFAEDSVHTAQYFKQLIETNIAKKDRHTYLFGIKRLFTYQQVKQLMNFPIFNRGRFRGGLIIEKINNQRFYPYERLARITLGFMKDDTTGARGIEYSFNKELRGKDGMALVQRVAGGLEIPINEFGEVDAQDGADVVTTLNLNLQEMVVKALEKGVIAHEALGGVAILMETATGKIKAIANYGEELNSAVATAFEPGSTFKIATAMVALEEGVVKPNDTINTGFGQAQYSDRILRDIAPYGRITFRQAFEKSSNVAMAQIISNFYAKQPGRFYDMLEKIGALTHTHFQLLGEPTPYVIRPGDPEYNTTTLPWLSTGYNILLTPLQLLTFVNAIANNGTMLQPLIVSQVRQGAEIIKQYHAKVLREKICSEATLRTIRELMEGVVERGSAAGINPGTYKIAGKTGTAKKLVGRQYQQVYRSSFVGYFPADKPKYTCFVMIDQPSAGEIYGSMVAAPVFREIADNVLSSDFKSPKIVPARYTLPDRAWDIPYSRQVNFSDAQTVYSRLQIPLPPKPGNSAMVFCKRSYGTLQFRKTNIDLQRNIVPDLIGMAAKDAMAICENLGLVVRLNGFGKVRHQSIKLGTRFHRGTIITLTLTP
jgi:cell division protein FtsI (penicillin-binding protein 3)